MKNFLDKVINNEGEASNSLTLEANYLREGIFAQNNRDISVIPDINDTISVHKVSAEPDMEIVMLCREYGL